MGWKKPLIALAAIACVAVAAIALSPYSVDAPRMESVREMRQEPSAPSPAAEGNEDVTAEGPAFPVIDWPALKAANPQACAWVCVPGTNVDYAVVQAAEDDPQCYLDHDLYGQASWYGCPYVDSACAEYGGIDALFAVVYGHHLINGTMFSDFAKFSDPGYAESHRTVLLCTPERNATLEVIAANVVDANVETIASGFQTADEMRDYVEMKLRESEVVLGSADDAVRVYAFVCCSYQTSNSRTIVYAKEVADG